MYIRTQRALAVGVSETRKQKARFICLLKTKIIVRFLKNAKSQILVVTKSIWSIFFPNAVSLVDDVSINKIIDNKNKLLEEVKLKMKK